MHASGGATALMYACQQCKESEVLGILRKEPYSVKDRDRTLKTPLHYCAENANTSCAEAILKVAPELVNAQDENGYCSLHLAVIAGNKPLIKLLITKGANVNVRDNEGHSAVHWAIVSSEKEALEMIIRAGANPSTPDIHGGYPLHYAVQMCGSNCEYLRSFEDTIRVVESLLNVGVDVNVKDKDGRQPILWAASAGSADAVIHLVSSGSCVEAADKDGLTALHCAASRGHTTTLETLISLCGANVDVIDGNGCSALFYSVTLGHADATELLLQLGAEPNRQDRKGRTPAHCGAAKGQLETLRILQKHGGNLWMRNVKGDIPLHEAVASGRKDLVVWLLSQNQEAINLANNDGRCPLHIASMYNNTEMVKVLLDSKSLVNPVMRTSKGVLMTPLNVALCKGHRSCGKYLQLHGGVPFSKVSRAEPATVFSVRVSPSDDKPFEERKENVTLSQNKISKSRSTSDVQGNQETLKTETADKKKVYRRRKKKKSQLSLNTQDSDSGSDESIHEIKVKLIDNRKSEKNNEHDYNGNDEDEEKMVKKEQLSAKPLKKEKSPKNSFNSHKSHSDKKQEISEETVIDKKSTKTIYETKPLQRNKSFSETKNVSDLSPEDFPPRMQTINQLDTVIMEPDVDVTKVESESSLLQVQDAGVMEVTIDSIITQFKTNEEVNKKSNFYGDGGGLSNEDKNIQDARVNKLDEEVVPEISEERAVDVKPFSGGNRKSESSSKTGSGSRSSNDESSISKCRKSSKSLIEEKLLNKDSEEVTDGSERQRKHENSKAFAEAVISQSETSSDAKTSNKYDEAEKIEIKNADEMEKDDKIKTKPVITPEIIPEEAPPKDIKVQRLEPESLNGEIKLDEGEAQLTEKKQKEKNSYVENALESSERKEDLKPLGVEIKTFAEEEGPMISKKEDEKSLVPEENDTGEVETISATGNGEKLSGEPPEPTEIFPPKTPKIASEKNSLELQSEQLTKQNHVGETVNQPEEKLEEKIEDKTSAMNSNSGKENTVEVKSDVLSEKESKLNKTEGKEMGGSGSSNKKFIESEQRHHKTPRVSRLCRRHREFKEDMNQISVTQLVQNTIRKYHMERGIFYQLLELKRYQIRSGKANEQVLVKRLADEYERSRIFLGMKPFSGPYKFREFEKFLYDQLKALNTRRNFMLPEIKSYDDIDALSGFLKKSRYKIISEIPQPEMICTCITQRCHHSAYAYTSVPCSAYITDLRRHRLHKPKRESFFPRIEQSASLKSDSQKLTERPATLELIQGSEKHVIALPQSSATGGKRYYVTFTIKSAPGFKEEEFQENSKNYFKHRHAKSV